MTILILADHDGAALSAASARLVTAACQIGGEIDVLVAGQGCGAVAAEAARLAGIRRVLAADDPALEHRLAEPLADLIVTLAADYDVLLAAAGSVGKDTMPRVAALLDVMQLSEIVSVLASDTFVRPTYAGNALETVRSTDARKVITVRTVNFEVSPDAGSEAPIEPVRFAGASSRSRFVGIEASVSDRPDLASARVVVSGGRALGGREGFEKVILPLAEKLNAAVGATRAAVDAGYVPNDWQVGQTGRIVAPELYIACGISGAIQHLAGMKESKVIVAINSDADAPIFAVADYGLVADLFEAVPELTGKL